MNQRFQLEIPAQSQYLCLIRGLLKPLLKEIGFSAKETYHVVLAVDEACSNVVRHAYKGGTRVSKSNCNNNRIIVKAEIYEKKIKIKIRDYGIKCDARKIRGRKLSRVRPGGLGVHLIHGCMDEVVYNRRTKGTELVLTKKRK